MRSISRSTAKTFAPSRAKTTAAAMPLLRPPDELPAPQTMAIFPSSLVPISSYGVEQGARLEVIARLHDDVARHFPAVNKRSGGGRITAGIGQDGSIGQILSDDVQVPTT